jgi:hypothetical protein
MTYDEWVKKVQQEAYVPREWQRAQARAGKLSAEQDADRFIAEMEARKKRRDARDLRRATDDYRARRKLGPSASGVAA